MSDNDREPNAPLTVVAGLVGAVLLFVLVVVLQAVFYRAEQSEVERKGAGGPTDELAQVRAEQEELLDGYRWVDEAQGVVRIPIRRAMELVVAQEQRRAKAEGEAPPGGAAAAPREDPR